MYHLIDDSLCTFRLFSDANCVVTKTIIVTESFCDQCYLIHEMCKPLSVSTKHAKTFFNLTVNVKQFSHESSLFSRMFFFWGIGRLLEHNCVHRKEITSFKLLKHFFFYKIQCPTDQLDAWKSVRNHLPQVMRQGALPWCTSPSPKHPAGTSGNSDKCMKNANVWFV